MRRPPQDFRDGKRQWGQKDVHEARQKADAERKRAYEKFRKHQDAIDDEHSKRQAALAAKRERFAALNIPDALAAAQKLLFADLEAEGVRQYAPLNRPTLTLIEAFLAALRDRNSGAVLQWPRGVRDVSILHPLSMLAVLGSPSVQRNATFKWCAAVADFRTIYYPWRGTGTGTTQRRILVDRDQITKHNNLHLTREKVGEAEHSPELANLHVILGHLHSLKSRDASKPHLAHPTLGEMYPTFGALGSDNAPLPFSSVTHELFGRVRHGAGLSRLIDHRGEISLPASAPFGFFGVCPRSDVKAALQHPALVAGRSPDICVLDLGPPGLSRLGHGWEKLIEAFLHALFLYQPETPVLAITQDIYVHRRVARLLANPGQPVARTKNDRSVSRILVRSSDDCFSSDPDIGAVTEAKFQFHSAGGQGANALRAISEAARRSSDGSVAGLLRQTMGSFRRAMSLPCGLALAHEVLSDTDAGAAIFLERRSAGTVLSVIKQQIELASDSGERARLVEVDGALEAAFNEFEADTPIGSLLAEITSGIARKSSPSVVAFASDYELLLGRRRVGIGDEQELIQKKIASGFIRLVTLQTLDTELANIESGRSRNYWKRLIVVAPPRDQFAVLLGRKWLPEEVIVIADREFVSRLGAIYNALASHPDLAGPGKIGSRLAMAAAAAESEARARAVAPVDLELDNRDPAPVDDAVIDLTGGDDDDDQEVVEIALESGRIMRSRPRSLIIRHDRFADVNPFQRTTANDIAKGNIVVVPNQAFVHEARRVLPVRILAQTRVQVYHAAVEAALPGIPGDSRAAKARHVIAHLRSVGAKSVVEATVLDWLNVAEHKQLPADRLRPHAPQNWPEFRAFMQVVKVHPQLAESIWREGIEPLRIDRRRAGARMAQAFVSVLVDSHGTMGSMPPEVREGIVRLRQQAMEHLDGVLSVRRFDGREAA